MSLTTSWVSAWYEWPKPLATLTMLSRLMLSTSRPAVSIPTEPALAAPNLRPASLSARSRLQK